jgi:predicted SnoaL-like aldol condensation-catalyzing enzyme
MLDGKTEVVDLHMTVANKRIVGRFIDDVFLKRDFEAFSGFFSDDQLVQHDPGLADGANVWMEYLAADGEAEAARYQTLHMLLGEGNFVLAVCAATRAAVPVAVYDLFRLANEVIAEHWSVVEVIAPRAEWKNNNGKF